jgi:hypothetical protein
VCDAELFNFFFIDRELCPRSLHPGFSRSESLSYLTRFISIYPIDAVYFAAGTLFSGRNEE